MLDLCCECLAHILLRGSRNLKEFRADTSKTLKRANKQQVGRPSQDMQPHKKKKTAVPVQGVWYNNSDQ